jgi:hypothetical protein
LDVNNNHQENYNTITWGCYWLFKGKSHISLTVCIHTWMYVKWLVHFLECLDTYISLNVCIGTWMDAKWLVHFLECMHWYILASKLWFNSLDVNNNRQANIKWSLENAFNYLRKKKCTFPWIFAYIPDLWGFAYIHIH